MKAAWKAVKAAWSSLGNRVVRRAAHTLAA